MKQSDYFALSDEAMRIRINLIRSCLDVIELCMNDHIPLAKSVVQMTVDNIVVLAEEMQEDVDKRDKDKSVPIDNM